MEKFLRNLAIVWLVVSLPVFLITYGMAMKALHDIIGFGWWSVIMLFHITAFLGIGSLVDKRHPQGHPSVGARYTPPSRD